MIVNILIMACTDFLLPKIGPIKLVKTSLGLTILFIFIWFRGHTLSFGIPQSLLSIILLSMMMEIWQLFEQNYYKYYLDPIMITLFLSISYFPSRLINILLPYINNKFLILTLHSPYLMIGTANLVMLVLI